MHREHKSAPVHGRRGRRRHLSAERQGIVIRPPSEAGSFLLQVTYGCSHNKCSFCLTYKFTRFAVRPFEKVKEDIELAARWNRSIRRVFLCDGDSMVLEPAELARILDCLADNISPASSGSGSTPTPRDILAKSTRELEMLREKKLRHRLPGPGERQRRDTGEDAKRVDRRGDGPGSPEGAGRRHRHVGDSPAGPWQPLAEPGARHRLGRGRDHG